jgi:hypothetical protein
MATLLLHPAVPDLPNVAMGVEDRVRFLRIMAVALGGLGMTNQALAACDEIASLRCEVPPGPPAAGGVPHQEQRPVGA